ncbi:MAG: hypothetical protein PF442_13460, partial [Desulfobulbaceae bacterium]|nr:hypothetical protein [Desulfobulbaceae bacterium]
SIDVIHPLTIFLINGKTVMDDKSHAAALPLSVNQAQQFAVAVLVVSAWSCTRPSLFRGAESIFV